QGVRRRRQGQPQQDAERQDAARDRGAERARHGRGYTRRRRIASRETAPRATPTTRATMPMTRATVALPDASLADFCAAARRAAVWSSLVDSDEVEGSLVGNWSSLGSVTTAKVWSEAVMFWSTACPWTLP